MKRVFFIITTVVALTVLSASCTQNNGDIGNWFGTWKLKKITIDGNNDKGYRANMFWKFQSSIIQMQKLHDHHTWGSYIGTWSQPTTDILRLEFIYSDNATKEGEAYYAPCPDTHLKSGITDLEIIKMSGKELKLKWVSETATYEYYLTKQ